MIPCRWYSLKTYFEILGNMFKIQCIDMYHAFENQLLTKKQLCRLVDAGKCAYFLKQNAEKTFLTTFNSVFCFLTYQAASMTVCM